MNPPCIDGYFHTRSQYFWMPPLELPMACVYSQRTNGFFGLFLTYLSTSHGRVYIGHLTSLWSVSCARSYCTGRVLSIAFIALYSATKLGPSPASLPIDQITMDGWLRNVLTMFTPRSTCDSRKAGFFA